MRKVRLLLALTFAAVGFVVAIASPASAQQVCVDIHVGINNIGFRQVICLPPEG